MPGELIPILLGLGLFAMLFGIRYLQNKETLAMIQNGLDPKLSKSAPQPYKNLKWALLLIGAGSGLFLAMFLESLVLTGESFKRLDKDLIYISMIGIFGGLGLLVSFFAEKKELDKNR